VAKCAWCGAETILHINGVPICTACDDKREAEKTGRKPSGREAAPARREASNA
jgi:hypothetical protein